MLGKRHLTFARSGPGSHQKAGILFAIVLYWMWTPLALAQGFAGLGSDATGYANPNPAYNLNFPADHGPHPDFRIEWWYVTANLRDADGRDYGVQWTLFRSAFRPGEGQGWQSPQVWMGHAAVTTPDAHFVEERFARGGIGVAGVTSDPFEAWIDDWHMDSKMIGKDGLTQLNLTASGAKFTYDLDLVADGPLVLHGNNGYSIKSDAGQASHYYSQPSYLVSGNLRLPDGEVRVTGHAWLDREWSSQPLAADQTGWDWFSLSFEDGTRLMAFALRGRDAPFLSGTFIDADGTPIPLTPDQIQLEPLQMAQVAGRKIPNVWRVNLADKGIDVTVRALNPRAWMNTSFPYWEGPVLISGSHTGRGYLEMTGY